MDSTSDYKPRINTEIRRLKNSTKNMPKNSKNIAEKLINRAAFMLVSLENMETQIISEGVKVDMQQGEYTIKISNPLITSYNTLIKNYAAVIKQLCDLLPDNDATEAGNKLLDFAFKPIKRELRS